MSPVPRTASSPRSGLSNIPSVGDSTPGLSGNGDDSKQRALRKKPTGVNGTTPTSLSSSLDQQAVSCYFLLLVLFRLALSLPLSVSIQMGKERKCTSCIFYPFGLSPFFLVLNTPFFPLSLSLAVPDYPFITWYVLLARWKEGNLSSIRIVPLVDDILQRAIDNDSMMEWEKEREREDAKEEKKKNHHIRYLLI